MRDIDSQDGGGEELAALVHLVRISLASGHVVDDEAPGWIGVRVERMGESLEKLDNVRGSSGAVTYAVRALW